MKFTSSLSKKVYLGHLKGQMSSHFPSGSERFTGFFLGPFFYVTHHSRWEWNRKITNQKNAALGYVKQTAEGCSVHFFRFVGLLCPLQLIPLLLFATLIALWDNGTPSTGLLLAITFVIAGIASFAEYLTEESFEGCSSLLALLADPKNSD